MMARLLRILGSLRIAVTLLILIAGVLAWGTLYEVRFGTASVQRFVYQSAWFQALLAFLGINLATAAFRRVPWKRKHIPFLLAHLGIIAILTGGILGGRLGVEGQMMIPEGEATDLLRMPGSVLVAHPLNPGEVHTFPVRFETAAWEHEPNLPLNIPLGKGKIRLTVDRYYPNAQMEEAVVEGSGADGPAVRLRLFPDGEDGLEQEAWLLAKDPERFGLSWRELHVLFLQPATEEEFLLLAGKSSQKTSPRGTLTLEWPEQGIRQEIPVPKDFRRSVPVKGTPYRVTFKQFFKDLAVTEKGVVDRSESLNNPAVTFTLTGPEGTEPYLLFALHPDFDALHGRQRRINARAVYRHPVSARLPPQAACLLKPPVGEPAWVFTDDKGNVQLKAFHLGEKARHPWAGLELAAESILPAARLQRSYRNRDNEVKAEAIHLTAQGSGGPVETWIGFGESVQLEMEGDVIHLEFRKALVSLPFEVKLLDFRKLDYPGTDMAMGFESDVELTDPQRGVNLKRTIRMNNPLKYRGFTLFQSSYVPEPTEMTVLSVRKDPGTPLVYTGCLIVIAGILGLFFREKLK